MGTTPPLTMPGSLLPGPDGPPLLVRRHVGVPTQPQRPGAPAVLYVHGGTFPSGLSVAFPFDGRSWADELAAAGLDVWAFDFTGFGGSPRFPEQAMDPASSMPLGTADTAADEVVRVLEHVAEVRGGSVSLLAHSWGTIAAGVAATRRPELVDRIVMFGPITRRWRMGLPDPAALGGWSPVSVQAQFDRFTEDVPAGEPAVLSAAHFAGWAEEWLATDSTAADRTPPSVRTPNGPKADIIRAWSGDLAYHPEAVQAPTCIVRGEWDSLCTDEDAAGLRAELGESGCRDVRLRRGTHLMHLECGRFDLYRQATAFLTDPDVPSRD